ncbi:MAG: hypothetical protein ACLSWI_05365 [Candidatus Gastranaerophilaceae bacterium]
MGLADLFKSIGNITHDKLSALETNNNINDYSKFMQPLQKKIEPIQGIKINEDGSYKNIETIPENNDIYSVPSAKFRFRNALFGQASDKLPITAQIQNNGDNTLITAGLTENPRQGGFIRDLAGGFNENLHNSFKVDNLINNKTPNDRNKGWAYRIGEGLGTAAKIADSPLGRMGITAGVIGALGGSPAQAAGYGATAGLLNQQTRTADNIYRKSLEAQGLDTSNLKGYVNSDVYRNYSLSNYRNNSLAVRQAIAGASDNTKRASLIMQGLNNGTITPDEAKLHMVNYGISFEDLNKSNATRNTDINEFLAPAKEKALRTAPEIAMGNLGLGWANYGLRKEQIDNQQNENPYKKTIKENEATLAGIDSALKAVEQNPTAFGFEKGINNHITNRLLTDAQRQARTEVERVAAIYRKWLTGAQMSDEERKAYESFLPSPKDNADIIKSKLKSMQKTINLQNQVYLSDGSYNKDPLNLGL